METFLMILVLIVGVGAGIYVFVSAARQAELRQPSTRRDIRALSANIGALEIEISDVSSNVSGVRKELGNLHSSFVTGIGEELEILHSDVSDVSSDLADIWEDLDGIRSDLAALRRLLKAIAHQQWSPEWTPE
jgi:uncharacterized protein (UPF0335 family)